MIKASHICNCDAGLFPLQILFSADNEAIGVEYERHGVRKQAFANKEVIISAGAINSPQLLMLSGIGPKKHLESFGVSFY